MATITKAARAGYAAVAGIANKAYLKLDRANPQTFTSLKQAKAYWAASAKIEGAFVAALRKITFPAEMASDVHTLIVRATTLQALDIELAHARSFTDLNSANSDLLRDSRASTAAANLVRSDLGLPPV